MTLLRSFILTAAVAAATGMSAQGLSAPDDPSQAPDAAALQTAPDSVSVPEIAPKHNTPSESYRAERIAIRQGNSEFNDSNYHRALEYYRTALMENSGSLAARYNYANTLLHLASDDNRGTQNDPRVAAAEILGSILPDALKYRRDIAAKALYNLGNMSYNDQNFGQAIQLYEQSLILEPENYDARYNLRLAQLRQQNQDQNQDQNQQQEQQQEQQQQEQQEQQEQQQEQQQQQQPMTQSAQQILQSMQNKENQTRRRVQEEPQPGRRAQPEKPW